MAAPFVTQDHLTAIALGFKNTGFIADLVAPRVDVLEEKFKWTEYNTEERFTVPSTVVGRKGRVNQIEFTAKEHIDSVVDYGLEDVIPQADIDAAKNHPTIDPEGQAAFKLAELIALEREVRVVNQVMNAANYTHSQTLKKADKWNESSSNVINQITDAMNTPLVTPNELVLGTAELLALRRHPQLVKAFNGSSGSDGLVPVSFIEELFGLTIRVGTARYNAARKGQPGSITPLWSGGAALIYTKPAAQLKDDVTFMLTAQYGTKVSGSWDDRNIGLRGGKVVRTGESVKEIVISKDAGYYFDAVL